MYIHSNIDSKASGSVAFQAWFGLFRQSARATKKLLCTISASQVHTGQQCAEGQLCSVLPVTHALQFQVQLVNHAQFHQLVVNSGIQHDQGGQPLLAIDDVTDSRIFRGTQKYCIA